MIQTFSEPADVKLKNFFREHRGLGMNDRAFVAQTVYGAVRHFRSLKMLTRASDSRVLVLAALVKYLGYSVAEVSRWVSKSEARQLAKVEAADLNSLPSAVRAELPDWLYSRLSSVYGETELSEMMRALARPAPLDLRVNTVLAKRDEVLAQLQSQGIAAQPTPYSPFGIRLATHPAINRHLLFLEGKVEVQDEASQLACVLVAPKPRDFIVDFCAGAGGKTLCLGALMHSRGRIYALDVSAKRLVRLSPRLKRSGLSNVHAKVLENEGRQRLAGKIDRVLVDAPCTGLGTLRRNPDLKWRQSPQSLAELTEKQAAILRAASRLVKDRGRLVYATCSILPEENDMIVAEFLESNGDFTLIGCGEILAGRQIPLDTGEMLRLFPHRHGTDGFFAAVMERTGD